MASAKLAAFGPHAAQLGGVVLCQTQERLGPAVRALTAASPTAVHAGVPELPLSSVMLPIDSQNMSPNAAPATRRRSSRTPGVSAHNGGTPRHVAKRRNLAGSPLVILNIQDQQAATALQRAVRVFNACKGAKAEKKRAVHAAVLIQSVLRAHLHRSVFLQQRSAALKIQKGIKAIKFKVKLGAYLGAVQRAREQRRQAVLRAASIITSVTRGAIQRRRFRVAMPQYRAALKMQRAIRHGLARRHLQKAMVASREIRLARLAAEARAAEKAAKKLAAESVDKNCVSQVFLLLRRGTALCKPVVKVIDVQLALAALLHDIKNANGAGMVDSVASGVKLLRNVTESAGINGAGCTVQGFAVRAPRSYLTAIAGNTVIHIKSKEYAGAELAVYTSYAAFEDALATNKDVEVGKLVRADDTLVMSGVDAFGPCGQENVEEYVGRAQSKMDFSDIGRVQAMTRHDLFGEGTVEGGTGVLQIGVVGKHKGGKMPTFKVSVAYIDIDQKKKKYNQTMRPGLNYWFIKSKICPKCDFLVGRGDGFCDLKCEEISVEQLQRNAVAAAAQVELQRERLEHGATLIASADSLNAAFETGLRNIVAVAEVDLTMPRPSGDIVKAACGHPWCRNYRRQLEASAATAFARSAKSCAAAPPIPGHAAGGQPTTVTLGQPYGCSRVLASQVRPPLLLPPLRRAHRGVEAGARAPERALFVLGAMNYESSWTHNWAAACGRGHASWVAGFGRRNSDAAWSHSCVGACGGGNSSRRVAKARVFAFFLMSGFNLEGKNIHVSSFMCVASDRR